jgi:RHS repeat-associated protein
MAVGHPVNPILGLKFLSGEEDLDFSLPAILPLPWQRTYYSDSREDGWLGQGWSTPLSMRMLWKTGELLLLDRQGFEISLPRHGRRTFVQHGQFYLCREANGRYRISPTGGDVHYLFAPLNGKENTSNSSCVNELPLVGMEDRNGNNIRVIYDNDGLPAYIQDSADRILELHFKTQNLRPDNSAHRLHRVSHVRTEHSGESNELSTIHETLVQYDYSEEGDLIRVSDAHGQCLREYRYKNHILIEHARPGALVASYEYDQHTFQGKVVSLRTNLGQHWKFRYSPGKTEVTDPIGRVSQYLFNSDSILTGFIYPTGKEIHFEVDGRGNIIAVKDPDGRTTNNTYDLWNNIDSATNFEGGRYEFLYHPKLQKPVKIIDPSGESRRFKYDDLGNLTHVIDQLGQTTEFIYDKRGLVTQIINAKGGRTSLQYDERGLLVRSTDCSQFSTHYERDDQGYPRTVSDAEGGVTRFRYDSKGHLLSRRFADGSEEHFSYDLHGRMIGHINAQGAQMQWELAADGLPTCHINALGHRVSYEFDAARRMTRLVNEAGECHRIIYDDANNIIEETGFDGRRTCYRYSPARVLIEKIEYGAVAGTNQTASAQLLRTRYEYNAAGQLVIFMVGRAGDKRVERTHFEYDSLGRIVRARNASGRIEMAYDAKGQLTQEINYIRGCRYPLNYRYDEMGNRIQTTLPNSQKINYLYYGSRHLHQVNFDGDLVCDFGRDSLHRETSRTQGKLTSFYRYDGMSRKTAQYAIDEMLPGDKQSPTVKRFYHYDSLGNMLKIDDLHSGVRSFQYDSLGRLTAAGDERFSFDPANNLLDVTAEQSAVSVPQNRLLKYKDKHYRYDAHGNLIEKSDRNSRMLFAYNASHQIESVRVIQGGGEQIVNYAYDAFGRRVSKRDASGVEIFLWEGNRLLSEIRAGRALTYLYEPRSFVPLAQIEMRNDGTSNDRYTAPVVRYFHTDQTGLPQELSDSAGRVVWRARYKGWGAEQTIRYPSMAAVGQVDSVHQPLRFQGQYHDHETGLHYNRSRYYDPDTGRFITQDPISLRGGINLYRYAPNPNGWIDPLGLDGADLNFIKKGLPAEALGYYDPMPGYFTVAGHGNPAGYIKDEFTGRHIYAQELSDRIRNSPNYRRGMPVDLLVCHAGRAESGLAQQVSNNLQTEVIAANNRVHFDFDGSQTLPVVDSPWYSSWQVFKPT